MSVFVDSSAFIALLDRADARHQHARTVWAALIGRDEHLVTTNYIVVETTAVLQRLMGLDAVREFNTNLLPVITIEWVDQTAHQAGVAALLAAAQRKLSLVDCTSFEAMRRRSIATVFAFDRHFKDQGFTVMP